MTSDLLVGVVGTGYGAEVHAPVLREFPGIKLAEPPASRQEVDALLDRGLDAITLALPPSANEGVVERALDLGIPILSEKPLAASFEAADRIATRAVDLTTAMGFQFAELDTFRALKEMTDDGRSGALRQIHIRWQTRSRADRDRRWSWKTDARRSGGVVPLMGSHVLYLLEWLAGPIGSVEATLDASTTSRWAPEGEEPAADTARFTCHLQQATAVVELSNAHGLRPVNLWRFGFEKGSAMIQERGGRYLSGMRLSVRSEGAPETFLEEADDATDGRLRPFHRLFSRFVKSLGTGEPMQPGLAAGARVQYLMQALDEAAGTGLRVPIDDRWTTTGGGAI